MAPRKTRNSIKKSGVLENVIHKTPKRNKRKSTGKNKSHKNDLILDAFSQHTTLSDKTRKGRKKKKNNLNKTSFIQETVTRDDPSPSPEQRNKNLRYFRTSESSRVHDLEFVIEENVSKDDFIPFAVSVDASKNSEGEYSESSRTASEIAVSSSTPEKAEDSVAVIVVDDDDDDNNSVCIEEIKDSIECESVNDSVQIITNTGVYEEENCSGKNSIECESMDDSVQIITNTGVYEEKNCSGKNIVTTNTSPSKRRRLNDSIEILEPEEFYNNRSRKKPSNWRNIKDPSTISNVILGPCDSDSIHFPKKFRRHRYIDTFIRTSHIVMDISDQDETENNHQQDEDIIVVDSVDNSSKDCVMLNDPVPAQMSHAKPNLKKTTNYRFVKGDSKPVDNNNPYLSSVFEDTVGSVRKSSAHYKSPFSSISNQDSDPNVSYHNVNGNNMYNPNSVEKTGLRPVIIDGSNVAFGHGGKHFSVRGIEICVNYFLKRGHNVVIAFVPLFRRSEVSDTDRKILDDLQTNRRLAFTPSRFLHGRRVSSYDDRFIVQCAAELGGIIVSTDNYRDLVTENEAWRETIEKRLLMFTWVGDILMFPDDPNGRGGPRLMDFLKFP